MEQKYWYLIIGFLIGFLVKTPLLIKYYKRIKKDKETMERIYNSIKNKQP